MSNWEYRTVRHVDPATGDTDITVHEFFIEDGEYTGFTQDPASPMSREEAAWMLEAFSRDSVVEVDSSTSERDQYGFLSHGSWKWLNKKAS